MKLRSLLGATTGAALVCAALAGATPAQAVARATAATTQRATVTPGSYLTVVEKGRPTDYGGLDPKTQSLVLVSPTGAQQVVYTRAVKHHLGFSLNDWSADGSTALLVAPAGNAGELIRVDVATGVATSLRVPLLNGAVLDPAGTGVFATVFKSKKSSTELLESISWAGATTVLRSDAGGMLAGHAGTVLTTDGRKQLLLSSTTGAVVSQFRVNGFCTPVRWWDASQVLEYCGGKSDLYLVDPTTGSHTQLTSGHGNGDYGHLDARYAGSQLYVQVAGACGYTYVAKVTKRRTKPIKVPHAVGNVLMVAAVGDDLVLEHAASCDGARPRAELTTWDPATHHETPLVTLGKREDFGAVLVLGEVHASTY